MQTALDEERDIGLSYTVLGKVFRIDWEVGAYLLLMAIAAAMRFWDLGSRALHHDESLHALYSWYIYSGRGYMHDPMMHGPFQFEFTALLYFLFGASDYTARVLPAIFGTVLVGLPYFLRNQLGKWGALVAALLFTFSPSILYYSRFARNDIYMAVWTLILVIALWRYAEERRVKYIYVGAAALAFSFATKETTFLHLAVFGLFLLLVAGPELFGRLRRGFNLSEVSGRATFLILLGTLSLPQFSAVVALIQDRLGVQLASAAHPVGMPVGNGFAIAALIVVAFIIVSALIGVRWNYRLWLISALIFYGIYFVLYTTFFTNIPGFGSGIWRSLAYWLEQHGVQRGGQPLYYYIVLLPIYEFLPLTFAVIGGIYYTIRGNLFSRFLVWWALLGLVLYSVAGEKMPWLVVNLALPIILLAAKFFGRIIESVDWRAVKDKGGIYLIILIPLFVLALVAMMSSRGSAQAAFTGLPFGQGLALAVSLAIIAGLATWIGMALGLRRALATVAVLAFVVMLGLSIRSGWQASYQHSDTPVEMLIYTQTSPDIPKIMKQIEILSERMTGGKDLPITVDSSSGFTWPWAWYLRDYKNVDYPDLTSMSSEPRGTLVLVDALNESKAKPYLTKYAEGRRFRHRWWFPEDYRGATLSDPQLIKDNTLNPTSWVKWLQGIDLQWYMARLVGLDVWGKWLNYIVNKEPPSPLGSSDAYIYFPNDIPSDLALVTGIAKTEEQALPNVDIITDLSFGSRGSNPGALNGPRGMTVDKDGYIYVADSFNHRIQKFDSSGRMVATVGRQGIGDGEFNEPWDVAVDKAGNVYVADTWNHRIQKFDSSLRLLTKWGENFDTQGLAQGNGGKFYGPRGIAVDRDGSLLVTDTGNKRVQKFSPSGEFIAAYGGKGNSQGQFMEPVGITVDGSGNIYVADTWNRRIQKFDRSFNLLSSFTVPGWEGIGVMNKPYLAVDSQGVILTTDPEKHRILQLNRDGGFMTAMGKYGLDNNSLNFPVGIAVDAQGKVHVVDSGNNRIMRFRPAR